MYTRLERLWFDRFLGFETLITAIVLRCWILCIQLYGCHKRLPKRVHWKNEPSSVLGWNGEINRVIVCSSCCEALLF